MMGWDCRIATALPTIAIEFGKYTYQCHLGTNH